MEIINKENFAEVTAQGIVLVDFFANWCGPCKMLGPVLENVASTMSDVRIVKVDVDQDPQLAGRYGIQAIPHMILFKDGQAVDQITGFVGQDAIIARINAVK